MIDLIGSYTIAEGRAYEVDSEELTLLELTGKTVKKVNECINLVNDLEGNVPDIEYHTEVIATLPDIVNQTRDLLAPSRKKKRAVFAFICDDGMTTDLTKIMPIVQAKTIPMGLAIPTGLVGTSGHMTWSEIKTFTDAGCEVLSHGVSHVDLSTLTATQIEAELNTSSLAIFEHGYTPRGFVYPYSTDNTAIRELVRKYYNYGVTRWGSSGADGVNYPKFGNYKIGRTALGSYFDTPSGSYTNQDTASIAYYRERVDKAIANNAPLFFELHSDSADFNATQQQYVKDIADYIRGLGYDIVSPSTAFAICGNPVEIGDIFGTNRFVIDCDGRVNAVDNYVVFDGVDKHALATKITASEYPLNKIIYTEISGTYATAQGYPENMGGMLVTHNLEQGFTWRYQEYILTKGSKKVYRRYVVDDTNNEWSAWVIATMGQLTVTKSVATQSVPANSAVSISVTGLTGKATADFVQAMPSDTTYIPGGLIWATYGGSGETVGLRIHNNTGSAVTLPTADWKFLITKGF